MILLGIGWEKSVWSISRRKADMLSYAINTALFIMIVLYCKNPGLPGLSIYRAWMFIPENKL